MDSKISKNVINRAVAYLPYVLGRHAETTTLTLSRKEKTLLKKLRNIFWRIR